MELAAALNERFGLRSSENVPSDPDSASAMISVAEASATEMEKWLSRRGPLIMPIGLGRTLKAAVECLPRIDCP